MKGSQIFRPSTYNIIVELKNSPSKYMLVHGCRGAINIASSNAAELLKPGNRIKRVNQLVSVKTFTKKMVGRAYEAMEETDHDMNLLDPKKIYSIRISVDGPKEIHDRRRFHDQDGGTLDTIFNMQSEHSKAKECFKKARLFNPEDSFLHSCLTDENLSQEIKTSDISLKTRTRSYDLKFHTWYRSRPYKNQVMLRDIFHIN